MQKLLGDIGGLQQSLYILGFILIDFFSRRIFVASILKQIYQVKQNLGQMRQEDQNNSGQIEKSKSFNTGVKPNRFAFDTIVHSRMSNRDNENGQGKQKSISVIQTSIQSIKESDSFHNSQDDQNQVDVLPEIEIQKEEAPQSFISSFVGIDNSHASILEIQEKENEQNFPQYGWHLASFETPQEQVFGNTDPEFNIKIKEDSSSIKQDKEQRRIDRVIKEKNKLLSKDLNSILLNLINRKRFKYTALNILEYVFSCLCLKRGTSLKYKQKFKKHFIFKKGQDKLLEELDIVSILKSMRQVKLLTQVLLNQRQNMILKFQRKNLIETSSSSEDSDNNKNYYTSKLMESKNPMIRLVIFGKLKKMVQSYKNQKLKELDKRLLRGLFIRKLKDFDEDLQDKLKNKTLLMRLSEILIKKSASSSIANESNNNVKFITNESQMNGDHLLKIKRLEQYGEKQRIQSKQNHIFLQDGQSVNDSIQSISKSNAISNIQIKTDYLLDQINQKELVFNRTKKKVSKAQ
ncbi:UNKNOWN [Stylonychia lemnae]|uniref:Uncharacterized protein n=1 Tax=Stylonychia lemnae TaxID=5949 RepID=A0A078ADD5_STYLE|nr:UNKNOWN [Stylonychia lemnae]|eukprot:CDW79542.1 UNKNOWN [Stylonychia lemnae]